MACQVADPLTPCRLWHGANIRGYGRKYDRTTKRTVMLHRWVWEQINGPIHDGMVVMHVCDTPACYRYDHLRLGTQLDNIADMTTKGRAVGGGGRYRGEQVKNAALTDEQAQQLRNDYNGSRRSIADVAAQYGVSKSTAHRIIRHARYA